MILRRSTIALLSGAVLGLSVPGGPAGADIMSVCTSEIGSYCSGVREGRGRIAACLVSNIDRLSGTCKPEVETLAQRTSGNRMMPASVRKMLSPGFSAPLPQACTADAGQYCPEISQGDGRVFACLYAHESQVSQTCSAAAETALDQAN